MKSPITLIVCLFLLFIGCSDDEVTESTDICPTEELLDVFTNSDGLEIFIYQNGELYSDRDGVCTFELQYFDPGFLGTNYETNANGTFLIVDGDELFPTKSNYMEDVEATAIFTELFLNSLTDFDSYWTNFTLQSPAAPEVSDYVALSKCILDQTCDFIDNKIELVNDPTNSANSVLKFTAVPPSSDMIVSKSSIISTLNYFEKNSEVWFEASFYIESGIPFSIVDFENTYFSQNPGPRVIISNNQIELENKFGSKIKYENNTSVDVPHNEWFVLKVHLKYSEQNDGVIELWQDGTLLISATGINLPTSNSIQNKLEVGATASTVGCELLVDNIRISETPF